MSKQKAKGRYYEHKTVDLLDALGFEEVRRVPASGALGKLDAGLADDVVASIGGVQFRVESKMRSHGFASLRKWIAATGFLVVHEQRKEPLVVLTREKLLDLLVAQKIRTLDAVERHLKIRNELRNAPEGGGEIA